MQGLGCRGWAGGAGEDGLDGLGRAVQEGPAPSRLHVRLCACMCARCACESRVRPTRAVTGPHPVQIGAAYQRGLSCKARRACERRWCGPRGPAQPPGRTRSRPGPGPGPDPLPGLGAGHHCGLPARRWAAMASFACSLSSGERSYLPWVWGGGSRDGHQPGIGTGPVPPVPGGHG